MTRVRNVGVLFLLTLLTEAAFGATLTMRAPSLEASEGGTVDVPIGVTGASGIGALHLEVTYDPNVIKADTVTRGALAGGNALIDFNPSNPGRLIIAIATLDDMKGDGVIANARFKVVGQSGQSSALGLEKGEAWEGATRHAVLVKTEAGRLTVKGGLPGWLLWALIGLAVLILLLLLLWLLRRRSRATATAPVPASLVSAPTPVPVPVAPTSVQPGGRFCRHCGASNARDSNFCEGCGKPLAQAAV